MQASKPILTAGEHLSAAYHLYSQIPDRVVGSIVSLAKLIFNAVAAALTFGQVKAFNGEVVANSFKIFNNVTRIFILLYAIVDPVQTATMQVNFSRWCFNGFEGWCRSSKNNILLQTAHSGVML